MKRRSSCIFEWISYPANRRNCMKWPMSNRILPTLENYVAQMLQKCHHQKIWHGWGHIFWRIQATQLENVWIIKEHLRISCNCCFVGVTPLASKSACFYVFLCIIPGSTSSVEEKSHKDTRNRGKHQHGSYNFSPKKRMPRVVTQNAEKNTYTEIRMI